MALADAAVATCISCAMRIEPSSESYIARNAIACDEAGDVSEIVDAELWRAHVMNPRDSAVLRSLGVRAELRGDSAEAEGYLLQAVIVDHSFLPRWTLANFYLRIGQVNKFWAAVRDCFAIIEPRTSDPRTVNAEAVFDLCWNVTRDSETILALIPPSQRMLLPYMSYLMRTGRTDAVIDVLPKVLPLLPSRSDLPAYVDLCEFLMRENRTSSAVQVWNYLVDFGLIHSTRLQPDKALSLANPDLTFPLFDRAFGWKVAHEGKVLVCSEDHVLTFEMGSMEKEHFELLSKALPVVGGRKYLLSWRVDPSRLDLKARNDHGLAIHLFGLPEGELPCPPLLSSTRTCLFTPPHNTTQLRMTLRYDRPLGEIRIEGALRLFGFGLEFQP
jgi:hypothetical protein